MFSGGISATLHVFNQDSQKWFNQVLTMSGTGNMPTAYLTGNHLELVKRFKNSIDAPFGDTPDELTKFVRSRKEKDLVDFTLEIFNQFDGKFSVVFWPIIESTCKIVD